MVAWWGIYLIRMTFSSRLCVYFSIKKLSFFLKLKRKENGELFVFASLNHNMCDILTQSRSEVINFELSCQDYHNPSILSFNRESLYIVKPY